MGSPAAAGRGGERNFAKPEVDQEHLLDVFKKYVKLLGVQACFSFEPYGNLAKTSALLKQLHEVEGSLAFKVQGSEGVLGQAQQRLPGPRPPGPLDQAELLGWRQGRDAADPHGSCSPLVQRDQVQGGLQQGNPVRDQGSRGTQSDASSRGLALATQAPGRRDPQHQAAKSRDPDAKPCDEAAKEYASSCEQSAQETSDQGTGHSRNSQERQDQFEPGSRRQSPAGQQGSNQEVLGWRGFEEASCSRQACEKGQAEEEAGR